MPRAVSLSAHLPHDLPICSRIYLHDTPLALFLYCLSNPPNYLRSPPIPTCLSRFTHQTTSLPDLALPYLCISCSLLAASRAAVCGMCNVIYSACPRLNLDSLVLSASRSFWTSGGIAAGLPCSTGLVSKTGQ
eukprot:6173002-Pleurochrysis_carterae.AAC.2